VVDGGGGLLQFVPDIPAGGYQHVLQTVFDVAEDVHLPVTFTMVVGNSGDPTWPDAINMIEKANAAGGDVTAQLLPRPIGLIIGLQLTANPFVLYPSYREIAHLPLGRTRSPKCASPRSGPASGRQARPRSSDPVRGADVGLDLPLDENPNYEPDPADSIGARARARGVNPMEEAYDRLLDDDGRAMLLVATSNLEHNSLNTVGELLHRERRDARPRRRRRALRHDLRRSYSTFFLAHWARDRKSGRFTVAEAVRELHLRTGQGGRPGRPGSDRGRIQSRLQRHRSRRPAAAQADNHLRPACGRASPRPDRRGLRRHRGLRRSDRREWRSHRGAPR